MEAQKHPPIEINIKSLNSDEVYKIAGKGLLKTSQALHRFILNYDINLKILASIQNSSENFLTKNIEHLKNLNSKNSTLEQQLEAESAINPMMHTFRSVEENLNRQFLYSFSSAIEDLCKEMNFFESYDEGNIPEPTQSAKIRIIEMSKSSLRHDPNWLYDLISISNYSRHFSEWSPIFDEIRVSYLGLSSTKDIRLQPIKIIFDRSKFDSVVKEIKVRKSFRDDSMKNIIILSKKGEVARDILYSRHDLSGAIIEGFRLRQFYRIVRKLRTICIRLEMADYKFDDFTEK